MITDQDLARRLRQEAALNRPVAPDSLDDSVRRAIAASAVTAAKAPARPIRFPSKRSLAVAACLAIALFAGGIMVKSRIDRVREMQALMIDMGNAASFFAKAMKPIAHGIRT